ncbi:MAG: glycosyltransferase [Desulfobacterales bacterium]|nr:glycosyltransferase [Desulfobacterales bacterium]
MTGGERVCEEVAELLGQPDIYCLLADQGKMSPVLQECRITTSFIQKIPLARQWYRYYAWLFPLAVESFDLREYDLVISSDANLVKGVVTRPETCHICYCHSPMRYAWSHYQDYLHGMGRGKKIITALLMHYLRSWDYGAAARVDYFIANSRVVRDRIRKYYRRDAKVIYPPCGVERFQVSDRSDDYYLCVSRLVGYKRIDLAVRAFKENGQRLVVAGAGPEMQRLKSMAGKNIEFAGWVSDRELALLYADCKALVFPGEEDFGIVVVEAQATGKPVIAYGRGGALETVLPGRTGLFFYEKTPAALNEAIERFERKPDFFDPQVIRRNANRFSRERFADELAQYIQWCLEDHSARSGGQGELMP